MTADWRAATAERAIASGAGARELPGTKFVYLQTVVTATRLDRCQMCHRAVDDPRFAQAPQPLTTHPKIPPHPFEKFGCTVCHQGQGRATTVADARACVEAAAEAGVILQVGHQRRRTAANRRIKQMLEVGEMGDVETVIGHLTAAHEVSDYVGRQFKLMAEATAIRAGREEDLRRWK